MDFNLCQKFNCALLWTVLILKISSRTILLFSEPWPEEALESALDGRLPKVAKLNNDGTFIGTIKSHFGKFKLQQLPLGFKQQSIARFNPNLF